MGRVKRASMRPDGNESDDICRAPKVRRRSGCSVSFGRGQINDEDVSAAAAAVAEARRRAPTPPLSGSEQDESGSSDCEGAITSGGLTSAPVTMATPAESIADDEHEHGDEASTQRLRQIIRQQFNLEIVLKHRELKLIEDEMAKVRAMMAQMRCARVRSRGGFDEAYMRHVKVPVGLPHSVAGTGPSTPGTPGAPAATGASAGAALGGLPSGGGSSTRAHTRSASQVWDCRRSDGVLVRLKCPKCSRSDFSNGQGFVNHCRNAHSLEFSSIDEAADECGVPTLEYVSAGTAPALHADSFTRYV